MTFRVRRLDRKDLPVRVDWFADKSVLEQMSIAEPFTHESTAAWFDANRGNTRRLDIVFVEVSSPGQERLLAMGGLVDIDPLHQRAELYILVNPALTGRGIGTQAVCWLCNYAFGQRQLHKVYLFTLEDNYRARNLYERLGFVAEGMLRQHVFFRGRFIDRYAQSILRHEWERIEWHDGQAVIDAE